MSNTQQHSPNYTARAQANYNKGFGKHNLSAIAGTEFRHTLVYGTRGNLFGYDDQLQSHATNALSYPELFAVTSTFLMTGLNPQAAHYNQDVAGTRLDLIPHTKHRYASGYANLTYMFDKRYTVFGSWRKDYADLFGGDPEYRGGGGYRERPS